jgi:tetratricopeptide (TPR) repeat protein
VLGHVDNAAAALQSQARSYRPMTMESCWHTALKGEILLAQGDFRQAAVAFSAGLPSKAMIDHSSVLTTVAFNGPSAHNGGARVAAARGDLTGAIDIYRQLLTPSPGQRWVAAFEPRYVLEIARLLTRTGQTDAARKEYPRFLGFWKNADPGLPEIAEARRGM